MPEVPGRFVAFEGPEGAGKSLQLARLAAAFRALGHEVVETREPGGTALGDELRSLLLTTADYAILPETEVLLLAAGRAQHVRERILPALTRGAMVLCDRYVDSTFAYQGGGRGLALDALMRIQEFATGGLMPDLRVLLDIPVDIGLRRRRADPDTVNRIDEADLAFHQRVRSTFLQLAAAEPSGWLVIDARAEIEEVAAAIETGVLARLKTVNEMNGLSPARR